MNEDTHIEDESGDRKYFTIIPNYILNHSSHWDREVYIQMKRISGEEGKCWTARKTLAKQCGMSVKQLDRCLKYLVEHEWIRRVGTRKIPSGKAGKGGAQTVNEYVIVDLWHKNSLFYKGGDSQSTPFAKGSDYQSPQGRDCGAHKEEHCIKEEPISATRENEISTSRRELVPEEPKPARRGKRADAHVLEGFRLWGKYPKVWEVNVNQRESMERLLEEHGGIEGVKGGIAFWSRHSKEKHCPSGSSPWALDNNWAKLVEFRERNSL